VSDNIRQTQHTRHTRHTQLQANSDDASISWWSWRPGIRPRSALLAGISLILLAFLFLFVGCYALLAGIIDSNSPPVRVAGVVTGYTTSILDSQPHLTIRLQQNGVSTTISPAITPAMRQVIHTGDRVTLDYSPHLHYLYALEARGQRYDLPGGSPLGSLFSSLAVILLGLALLPYPLILTWWGWHDLQQPGVLMPGKVVGLRTTQQTRTALQRRVIHPGLTPRIGRAWYGVALEPLDVRTTQEVITFSLKEEQFKRLHKGQSVQIMYSPHLHHVLSIKQIETAEAANNG